MKREKHTSHSDPLSLNTIRPHLSDRAKHVLKFSVSLASLIIFILIFAYFYEDYGRGFAALGIFPVCTIGWCYGLRSGIVCGFCIPFCSYIIMNVKEDFSFLRFISAGGSIGGILGHIGIGAVVGRMADLSRRVRKELTERKKIEQELRDTSDKLLSLINASPLAIVVTDTARKVSIWNPAAEHIFGWTAAEMVGNVPTFIKHGSGTFNRLFGSISLGKPVMGEEMTKYRKDGTPIDISFSAAPLCDHTGAVSSIITIMADITEHKRLQKEITTISSREQRRIGQDLHDGLGQVLTGISFICGALQQKLSAKALDEARDAAEVTGLVNEAIAQTRNLSRMLYPVTLDSEGLTPSLDELASSTEDFFHITCTLSCPGSIDIKDPTVSIHLYRIVQEAINNAIRHGKADRIHISLDRDFQGTFVLAVADNGSGMNGAPPQSSGLGIVLMQHRARLIGAHLDIRGEQHEGVIVTCTFTLPDAA